MTTSTARYCCRCYAEMTGTSRCQRCGSREFSIQRGANGKEKSEEEGRSSQTGQHAGKEAGR